MKKTVLFISLFIGLAFWGCDNKGIINGGYYKNDNMDRLNTYYKLTFSTTPLKSLKGPSITLTTSPGRY